MSAFWFGGLRRDARSFMLQQHLVASAFNAAQMLGFVILVMTTEALIIS